MLPGTDPARSVAHGDLPRRQSQLQRARLEIHLATERAWKFTPRALVDKSFTAEEPTKRLCPWRPAAARAVPEAEGTGADVWPQGR